VLISSLSTAPGLRRKNGRPLGAITFHSFGIKMEYISHGINIYFESIGNGLPVLFIHGHGPDHRSLKGCMEPCFSKYDGLFKRIYFDLPGMGKSKGNEWLSSADKLLDLVINFIEYLVPNQSFLLVGNSYGGYLARGIVKKKQSLIKGLLLLCPMIKLNSSKPAKYTVEKDELLMDSLSDEDRSYFEPIVVRQTKPVWERYKVEVLSGLKISDELYITNNWGRQKAFSFDVDILDNPLEKPVLIITGKQDSITGYSSAWDLLKNYPRASLVVLDNAGHALQIEQSEIFNCLTKNWIERVIHSENMKSNGA